MPPVRLKHISYSRFDPSLRILKYRQGILGTIEDIMDIKKGFNHSFVMAVNVPCCIQIENKGVIFALERGVGRRGRVPIYIMALEQGLKIFPVVILKTQIISPLRIIRHGLAGIKVTYTDK